MNPISRIATDESLRELAPHGSAGYPFQYYYEDVWDFDLHCIDWHWHPELEFVYLEAGEATACVAGEALQLRPGCGLFINSRAVHRFSARSRAPMPNFLFLPSLLAPEGSLIERRYVRPLLEGGPACVLLEPQTAWQAEALRVMRRISALCEGEQPCELSVLRLLIELWELLVQNVELRGSGAGARRSGEQARLQIMLQFIHEHSAQPLSLQQIAEAAFVSKSSALQIFREGIGQSPVAYLIRHRLTCAARLLRTTERSVSAIAAETGFASAGYFCRRFRELFGASPGDYRRQRQAASPGG